jgi:hypothetical protein
MNKFNVGDQVALICDYGGYKIEDAGVVLEVDATVMVRMSYPVINKYTDEEYSTVNCFSYRLRLVDPISLEDQIKELLG